MTWNAQLYFSKDIIPNLSSFHTALPVKFMVMKYHAVCYCKFPSKLRPGNSPGKPRSGHGIQKPGCGKSLRRLLFQDILPRSQHTCHKRRHTEAQEPWLHGTEDGKKKGAASLVASDKNWYDKMTKTFKNNKTIWKQYAPKRGYDKTIQNTRKEKYWKNHEVLRVAKPPRHLGCAFCVPIFSPIRGHRRAAPWHHMPWWRHAVRNQNQQLKP